MCLTMGHGFFLSSDGGQMTRPLAPAALWLISALLPACYLSSWPEEEAVCAALPSCDVGYSEVGFCMGEDCTVETLCTWSIYCERDCDDFVCADFESEVPWCDVDTSECSIQESSCGEVYCQSALCNGLPSCDAGEAEVATCAGEDECQSVSVCGTTIYCAPPCDIQPLCGPDQIQYADACPPGQVCERRSACGETIYCTVEDNCTSFAPCTGAPSSVVGGGRGLCPLVTPGPGPQDNCYSQTLCGVVGHCVLACDLGHSEVGDPSECWEGSACYRGISLEGEVWCTGEGLACEAEPFCEEEEIEIPLDVVCGGRQRCRIVEECGISIQCEQQPNVDG